MTRSRIKTQSGNPKSLAISLHDQVVEEFANLMVKILAKQTPVGIVPSSVDAAYSRMHDVTAAFTEAHYILLNKGEEAAKVPYWKARSEAMDFLLHLDKACAKAAEKGDFEYNPLETDIEEAFNPGHKPKATPH
ncbi:hypothetical protein ACFL1B_02675 [Nanoarchaeota archaeon]